MLALIGLQQRPANTAGRLGKYARCYGHRHLRDSRRPSNEIFETNVAQTETVRYTINQLIRAE